MPSHYPPGNARKKGSRLQLWKFVMLVSGSSHDGLPRHGQQRTPAGQVDPFDERRFDRQHPIQDRVQRARRHLHLTPGILLRRQAQGPLDQSKRHQDRQHRSVGIGETLDYESSALKQVTKSGRSIASDLVCQDRMIAAQRRHSSHVNDDSPPGTQDPKHLRHGRPFVRHLETIEHVEGRHQVKPFPAERKSGHGGSPDLAASGACALDAYQLPVDPAGTPVVRQDIQVCTGAAATIENVHLRPLGLHLRQQGTHEATEPTKPEVVALDAGRNIQEEFHQLHLAGSRMVDSRGLID